MSRLNQIRFALFLILCAAIFAFQAKRVIDLERPAAKPESVSFEVDKIFHGKSHLSVYLVIPAETAKKMNIPSSSQHAGYPAPDNCHVTLIVPVEKCAGVQNLIGGKFRCEMLLYPTGAAKFSRLVPVSAE